jgi:hypothetical protein
MKYLSLIFSLKSTLAIFLCASLVANIAIAQTPGNSTGTATGTNATPWNTASQKTQLLYAPSDFSVAPVSGMITKVYFRNVAAGATGTYTDLRIRMMQNNDNALTTTYYTSGFSTVLSSPSYIINGNAVAMGWYEIPLANPYPYDNSKSLIIEIQYTAKTGGIASPTFTTTGRNTRCSGTDLAATTGTTGTTQNDLGIDIVTTACSSPIGGTSTAAPAGYVCTGTNITLGLTGASFGLGQTFQWQRSISASGPFANLGSPSAFSSYIFTASNDSFYRCEVTCSGNSDYSIPVQIQVNQGLSGNYTINSNVATGGTNFQTYAAAISAMSCGVAGPVVFNVDPASGPYNEQVVIPQIARASATNRITFNGNGTTIQFAPVTAARHIVKLDGADYITLKNLNITELASGFCYGIHLINGANFDSIINCKVDVSANTATTSTQWAGIVASGSTTSPVTAGNSANNLVINGCKVIGGYYSVCLAGASATARNAYNQVINDSLLNFFSIGVNLIFQDSAIVSRNDMNRKTMTVTGAVGFEGVEIASSSKNCIVSFNRIHDSHTASSTSGSAYPIFVTGADAPVDSVNYIYNNLIYNINNSTEVLYGMYNLGCDGTYFYQNTVVLDHAGAISGNTRGFWQSSIASNIVFKNNNIYVSRGGTGTKYCFQFNTATSVITSENNNLYAGTTTGSAVNVGGYNSIDYATIAAWKTANGGAYDQLSKGENPVFLDPANGDYTPTAPGLNNMSPLIPFITTDINGAVRGANGPFTEPGAYEYTPGACSTPVAGTAITSAVIPPCANEVFSLDLLNFSANSGQIYTWESSATSGGTFTPIGPGQNTAGFQASTASAKFYRCVVACPATSQSSTSSEVQVMITPVLAAGNYTIDASLPASATNFQTFTGAVQAMKCGTTGKIVFNVKAGSTYSEAPILLSNLTDSVVFQRSGVGANPVITGISGAGTTDAVITINGCSKITFDGIDVSDNAGTGNDRMDYGYKIVNSSATNGSSNNTIKNTKITLQRANATSIGILQSATTTGSGYAATALSGGNHNNRYENVKVENSYNGIFLLGTAGFPDSNNIITSSGANATIIGGLAANDIGNGTTIVYGIQCTEQKNVEVSKCTVRNVTHAGTLIPAAIWINNASTTVSSYGKAKVFGNTLFDLSRITTTAATGGFCGIKIDIGVNSTAIVYNNIIYGMSTVNPTTASATVLLRGIAHGAVTGTGVAEYYNNSVNISTSSTNASSAAFWKGSGASVSTLRNNILSNTSDPQTGVAKHYGIYLTAGGSLINSNNVIYAPNANGFVGFAVSDRLTLPLFAAAISNATPNDGNELGSANANPNFTSPADLTFSGATPAALSGTPIATITTDIMGNARNIATPTIGAFETVQPLLDASAPIISNVIIQSGTAPYIYATVKDNDNTIAAIGNIQLWYRAGSSGAFTALVPDSIPVNNMSGTYKWSAAFNSLPLGPFQFYIAARDLQSGSYNVSVNPIQAATFTGFSTVDPINYLANPDIGVTVRSFSKTTVLAAATYSVGAGGSYVNLTAVANIIPTIQLTGDVVFELQNDYDGTVGEVFPITFTEFASLGGPWKITIRPAAGVTMRETSGYPTASGSPLINLNGIKRIILDGRAGGAGTTSDWMIRSKRSAGIANAPAVLFINGAQNDTLKYIRLESGNTTATSGTVLLSTSSTVGNSNNAIANCTISHRSDTLIGGAAHAVGIYSSGTAGFENSNNTITQNNILNWSAAGVQVTATGNGSNWVVSNNSMYTDTVFASAQTGISFLAGAASTSNYIINNSIGGSAPLCGGSPMVNSGNIAWRGIVGSMSQTDSSFIHNNTIQNINLNGGTGTYAGIEMTGGLSSIKGNIIGSLSTPNSIFTSQLGTIISIWINNAANSTQIYNNTIANITSTGVTTAVGHNGIRIATGVVSNPLVINNNTITNLSAATATTGTTTASIIGILSQYAGTLQTITNNNISNLTNSAQAATNIMGINITNGSGLGTISGNKITGLGSTSNMATSIVTGIHLDLTSAWNVVNNMIILGGLQDSSFVLNGIQDKSGTTANNNIYYNTVVITGSAFNATASASQAYRRTTGAGVNIRNNIFVNTRTGGMGNYAISNTFATPATGWKANYNDLYSANAAQTGLWNATANDFATWKITSIHDTSSININPTFISATDLHLALPTIGNVSFAARPIAEITKDFDGQTRDLVTPYMGADENTSFPLPVTLVQFTATQSQNDVLLNWATATETNSSHFIVERSVNGKAFEAVAKVKASGKSNSVINYRSFDANAFSVTASNTLYYRLRMVDNDGKFEYSKTAIVSIKDKKETAPLNVFPNPYSDKTYLHINATAASNANISVVDITGKVVISYTEVVAEGSSVLSLQQSETLKAGIYFISIEVNGIKQVAKLVKQ